MREDSASSGPSTTATTKSSSPSSSSSVTSSSSPSSSLSSSSSSSVTSSSLPQKTSSLSFPEGEGCGTIALMKQQMLQNCKQFLSPPPFVTSLVTACLDEIRAIYRHPREALLSFVNLLCVLFTALMLWKVLVLASNSPSPVVVVLSGSMEPAFFRGDILFLVDRGSKLDAGDIIVFKVEGRDIPIVHRVLSLHEDHSGNVRMLTKGDNNSVDDRGLYAEKQLWLEQENVMGTTVTFLPSVGLVTILLNNYPLFKWGAIACMVVLALLGYE